jgi:hypothetical protein
MGRSVVIAALLALGAAVPARADTVDATVTTLLAGRQDPRDGRVYTVVPAYEMLQLRLDDVQTRYIHDIKVVVSAWGEVAFGDPREGHATGDVDLGYVEGSLGDKRLTLRAGRQFVWGGAARIFQLDGGSLRVRVVRRLYLDVFGGVPVTPRFAVKLGDAVAGGRASWRQSYDTEFGLSYMHVLDEGRVARQDLGADARITPVRPLSLTGYFLYSLAEMRVAEADAGITWQPHRLVDLRADYRRTAPDLFLPRSSILSVFADTTRDEAGASIFARPVPRLTLYGDYYFVFDDTGFGQRGGGKATLRVSSVGTLVGLEGRFFSVPGNGYTRGRLFASHPVTSKLLLVFDVDAYLLDQAINGTNVSLTGSATVAWDFARGWRLAVTGLADTTPLVERRFEIMGRLVYNHTWRFREVRK